MLELLPPHLWPKDYENPAELEWVAECDLIDFSPWTLCHGEWLVHLYQKIAGLYPNRTVVPIAKRGDNDDTACWDVPTGSIVVLHVGAASGSELRATYDRFWAFFESMLADFVERGKEDTGTC